MDCPIDGTQLVISDRAGVEIDYCPKCRGVWLDRGELDKILDRTIGETRSTRGRDHDDRRRDRYDDDDDKRASRSDDRKRDYKSDDDKYRRKSKKGKLEDFIGDLFDF